MTASPYVVGQWVRGERFYGRGTMIEELLDGPRDWLWICGTRRVGKTSILKQLEWITTREPERGYLPLFWDLQGSGDGEELRRSFDEAILDAEELLQDRGIEPGEIQAPDLFDMLSQLRRRVHSKGQRLLLLCDEVEELIGLHRADPLLLRKLRRALQSKDDLRTVMTSTIRLWALADQTGETSPFLHGFTPPLYIQRLSDAEAHGLIGQLQLPASHRPALDAASIDSICATCDNHPYLLQLVGKRCVELGNLTTAIESVTTDEMVSYFFSVDFEMLSPSEKDILRKLSHKTVADSDSLARTLALEKEELAGYLQRLDNLGYVRRGESGQFEFPSYFFQKWMAQRRSAPVTPAVLPHAGWTDPDRVSDLPTSHALFDARYQLLSEIGKGATGVVYRATDEVVRETIAIKIIRKEYGGHAESLARLRQEITLARDLGHPNILRVYHLGECHGQYYITMRFIDGETLADLMLRQGALPLADFLDISRKLASALDAAHSKRVLHRDIKPQNVLIDQRCEPYLTDFGLARLLDMTGPTESGVYVGTPTYSSPEQADLRPLDHRSDIYSLGAVLFEMATGSKPFESDDIREVLHMHRNIAPPDPLLLRPELPSALSKAILRCLAKAPGDRFQSALELQKVIESVEKQRSRA